MRYAHMFANILSVLRAGAVILVLCIQVMDFVHIVNRQLQSLDQLSKPSIADTAVVCLTTLHLYTQVSYGTCSAHLHAAATPPQL